MSLSPKILLADDLPNFRERGIAAELARAVAPVVVVNSRPMGACGWRGDIMIDEIVMNSGAVVRGFAGTNIHFVEGSQR